MVKHCPFSGEPCTTNECLAYGTLSEDGSDKSCLIVAGCIASIVQANRVLRENRGAPTGLAFDAVGEDDDDELPSSRPRRF